MVKDFYHQHVVEALIKDGWTITNDPFYVPIGNRRGYIDLGAEKSIIAAEKTSNSHLEKIAVEIKSFISKSDLNDFEGFPKATLRSDLVNLRMLNDETIVGDLNYATMQGCSVFISNPTIEMPALREKYGPPDSERKMKNGGQISTYGRFRVFGDSAGKTVLVVYKPDVPK